MSSFSQDGGDLTSQNSGYTPSGRVGSSHGVIRGSHVQVVSGSSGHAVGRLGGATTIPQPPEFGEDVSAPRAQGSSNYFGRVSSKRLSIPDSSGSNLNASSEELPAASLPWANEAYKQRLTLSRQGGRSNAQPAGGTTSTLVRNQLATSDAETLAIHDALVPQEGNAQMERRSSLISGALGRRRQSNPAVLVMRTQALAAKQDYIRGGGGGEMVSRSSFSSVTTGMAIGPPLGTSGFESRPPSSGGVGRPASSGGMGVAPVNPLTNRSPMVSTNGKRVGHLHGAARSDANNTNSTTQGRQRAVVEENDGCFCF